MALIVLTYDLPPEERLEAYNEKTSNWISIVLKQPGLQGWRAFRNPMGTTPQVMTLNEFDNFTSAIKFTESEDYAKLISEMRALGCHNFRIELWDTSPFGPDRW